jgi:hypothetical protein
VVYRARAGTRQKISIAANGACNLAFSGRNATPSLTVHDDKVLAATRPKASNTWATVAIVVRCRAHKRGSLQLSAVASRHRDRRMRLWSFPTAGGDAVYTAAAMYENAGAMYDGL